MRDNKEFIKSLAAIGPKQSLPRFVTLLMGVILAIIVYYGSVLLLIFSKNKIIYLSYFFTVDNLLMLFTGVIALITTIKLMYPDRALSRSEKWLPFFPFVSLFIYFVFLTFSYDLDVFISCLLLNDSMCFVKLLYLSFIPVVAGLFMLTKGFVIQSKLAGIHLVLAVASFGYMILRIFETPLNPLQMFIWHYLPVVLLLLIGPLVGKYLNRR